MAENERITGGSHGTPDEASSDQASDVDSLDIVLMQDPGEIGDFDWTPKEEGSTRNVSRRRVKEEKPNGILMSTITRPLKVGPGSSTARHRLKLSKDVKEALGLYACEICDRSYVHIASLKRHMNTHSWQKTYPCNYCDKVFAMAEHRTKHEIMHTGEMRYQCLLCTGQCQNYSMLITHCRQQHNVHPSGKKESSRRRNRGDHDIIYRVLTPQTKHSPQTRDPPTLSSIYVGDGDNDDPNKAALSESDDESTTDESGDEVGLQPAKTNGGHRVGLQGSHESESDDETTDESGDEGRRVLPIKSSPGHGALGSSSSSSSDSDTELIADDRGTPIQLGNHSDSDSESSESDSSPDSPSSPLGAEFEFTVPDTF